MFTVLGPSPKLVKQNKNWFCVFSSLEIQDKETWGETWKGSTKPGMFHRYLAFESLPLPLTTHYWRCDILFQEESLVFSLWRVEDFFLLSVWEEIVVWPAVSACWRGKWRRWGSLTLSTANGGVCEAVSCLRARLSHHHGSALDWQRQHRGFLFMLSASFPARANYSHSHGNSFDNFTSLPSLPRKIVDSVRISEM